MSVNQVTVWTATCDRCGRRTMDDSLGCPMSYRTQSEAVDDLVELGWSTADPLDNIAVCGACRVAIDSGEQP